jgi:6-phosphogluconolactonase
MTRQTMTTFTATLASLVLLVGCAEDEGDGLDAADTEGMQDESESSSSDDRGESGGDTDVDDDGSDGGGSSDGDDGQNNDTGDEDGRQGFVFTLSNAAEGNEVVVFARDSDGRLEEAGTWPTAGLGSGDALGSQGAVVLSPDGRHLYAVNAGSNQISAFEVYDDHLALVSIESSGGERPVSITANDALVYVLNAGADGIPGGVRGFATDEGRLMPIASAVQPLSDNHTSTAPSQVGLSPEGNALIVTERATNDILTYWVAPDGSLSAADISPSEGETPFGFAFRSNGGDPATLVVSEAFGGQDGASAVSSYAMGGVDPAPISSSVPTDQTAACWLIIARGRFAYTTNTPSNTISGFHLADDGSLELFDDGGITAFVGSGNRPLDMALAEDDKFLYAVNGESHTIRGYEIAQDGTLTSLGDPVSVPETSFGLAAR